MTHRSTHERPLTALQQAILDVIWARTQATAEDVRAGLLPEHPLKDTTVRTLLKRLEARGFLEHRVDGKVFVYSASVQKPRVAARALRDLIEQFWSGSTEQFLVGMVSEKVLTLDEIRSVARKVEKRR